MGGSWVGRSFNPALGVGFFAIEYPGYPLSKPGKISEQSAYEVKRKTRPTPFGLSPLLLAENEMPYFGLLAL